MRHKPTKCPNAGWCYFPLVGGVAVSSLLLGWGVVFSSSPLVGGAALGDVAFPSFFLGGVAFPLLGGVVFLLPLPLVWWCFYHSPLFGVVLPGFLFLLVELVSPPSLWVLQIFVKRG